MSSSTSSSSSSRRLRREPPQSRRGSYWCCSLPPSQSPPFSSPLSHSTHSSPFTPSSGRVSPVADVITTPHNLAKFPTHDVTVHNATWRIISPPGRVSPVDDVTNHQKLAACSVDDVTSNRTLTASPIDDVINHHATSRVLSQGRVYSPTDDVTTTRRTLRASPVDDVTARHALAIGGFCGQCGLPAIPKGNVSSKTMNFTERLRFGGVGGGGNGGELGDVFDVRMNVKARSGENLVLELNSEVLVTNSVVFGDLIADCRKNDVGGDGVFRIEVPEVEDVNVFRLTIELMFEEDVSKRVIDIGVYRAIDVLEVAVGIKFNRGVSCCLKYIEAMPWTEEEEEKLKIHFSKYKFDDAITKDICARLYSLDSAESQQNLTKQLVWSITTSSDNNARTELKSLVRGLLSRSSLYVKNHHLNGEDILAVCQSCLNSLNDLVREAAGLKPSWTSGETVKEKPLVDSVSKQVDNLKWLLEILVDHQIAEDFVNMWANQKELLKLHGNTSPLIRYELSRVSAVIFIAMGSGKLHCKAEERSKLLKAWFKPMLMDYGWLQRCKKGLDIKVLEEAIGQTLLTLPLKEQHTLFMDWFDCFSKSSTECPNLSKAFQVWWRRSFLRGSETVSVESR